MRDRIFYLDSLRALAIIGVVLCHISANYVLNLNILGSIQWDFALFSNCFRDFSIPIFVMISGALLIKKDENLVNFISKKFNRIFLPYIFWEVIFLIFSLICFSSGKKLFGSTSFTWDFLYGLIFGLKGFGSIFWFIWMILLVYALLFLMNRIIIKLECYESFDSKFINLLLVLFFFYVIGYSLKLYAPSMYENTIIYYMGFMGYALLGYKLKNVDFTKKLSRSFASEKRIMICSFIISISLFFIILYINKTSTISLNHLSLMPQFNILVVLLCINIFLFFRYFEENKRIVKKDYISKSILSKVTNSLSMYSFGIYLSHRLLQYGYMIYLFNWLGFVELSRHNPIK